MNAAGTIGSAALAVKSFPAVKHEIGYYMAKYQCKTQSAIPTDEGATTATAKSAGGRLGNSATRQQNKAIDLIFEYSGVKSLSAGAQIISFLLLNFELLLLIPRLHLHTCNSLNLLFSWIFFADIWGYVPLGVLCLLSTVVVYERANRGDLLK